MGRRRRRVIRIVKKKLPTVFVCPRCGEEAVRVSIAKDTGKAVVLCALCSLKDEFQAHPAAQMIDVYSYFTDRFYGVKDPRPIIPREREVSRAGPVEEEAEEPPEETAIIESTPQPPVTVEKAEKAIVPVVSSEPAQAPTEPTTAEAAAPETKTPSGPEPGVEAEPSEKEEEEPFADILQQNKDKKRYSATPLPEQSSEQATES